MNIVDLSYCVDETIPAYPGDTPYAVNVAMIATGPGKDPILPNLSQIRLGLHVGTHGDAPFHFWPSGNTIDKVDLHRGLGAACKIILDHIKPGQAILVEHLKEFEAMITQNPRILFWTGWDKNFRNPNYFTHHPYIHSDTAKYLLTLGVITVGMDFPSVDYPPHDTHFVLLGANIFILENLTGLEQLPTDGFSLAALPLKLRGRDGSPVRAVAFW
ncbi:MAG: cyclase family protein [Gemmataceae bacterium]|nr:cyclase family protein [Gemmataceae bacterium]